MRLSFSNPFTKSAPKARNSTSPIIASSSRSDTPTTSTQSPPSSTYRRAALASLVAGIAATSVFAYTNSKAIAASSSTNLTSNQIARIGQISHTEEEWRSLLSPDSYAVLRQASTERRNSSPLTSEHRTGTFICGGCGSPLFTSESKYESGTGWPSFYDVIPGAVDLTLDESVLFMPRTEVRCHTCQGHLGHVFPDGPKPTGMRYCMNGAAMGFKPKEA